MVLQQFSIIKDNHKLIIVASMIIGALYPFFIDSKVPVINDPKYVSIGALLFGMVLFWEIYGQKRYPDPRDSDQRRPPQYTWQQHPVGYQYPPQPYNPIHINYPPYNPVSHPQQPQPVVAVPQHPTYPPSPPYQQRPQNPTPQPYSPQPNPNYPPNYEDQLATQFVEPPNPPQQSSPPHPLQEKRISPPQMSRPSTLVDSEDKEGLPKISDVVQGKVSLPDRIPFPKELPSKESQSPFKKFGYS